MSPARLAATAIVILLAAHGGPAVATQINTGETGGAYNVSFCPALAGQLRLAQFDYQCTISSGTRENMDRVLADPRQLGYGQLDAFVLESRELKADQAFTLVRQDDVRECLFAITRNKEITNWGELSAYAPKLRFILPPANSGSASTFRFLRGIDADGLGRAASMTHALSAEDAIREALSADDTVTLLVQFADPDSERFALVRKLGGHIVPVIDRTILRQEVGSKKIYFAQETQVENAQWIASGKSVVTACTPLVVFTGTPERVTAEQARKDQEDLIRTIAALKPETLLPQETLFKRLLKRSKELSAISTQKALDATERAREKARPYTDKAIETAKETAEQAKQAAERASEAAKPYLEKSKQAAQKAYDDALKVAKDLMDKSKSEQGGNKN